MSMGYAMPKKQNIYNLDIFGRATRQNVNAIIYKPKRYSKYG